MSTGRQVFLSVGTHSKLLPICKKQSNSRLTENSVLLHLKQSINLRLFCTRNRRRHPIENYMGIGIEKKLPLNPTYKSNLTLLLEHLAPPHLYDHGQKAASSTTFPSTSKKDSLRSVTYMTPHRYALRTFIDEPGTFNRVTNHKHLVHVFNQITHVSRNKNVP